MKVIQIPFNEDEAWCFAQFLKRAGYSTYREWAVDETEACTMLQAAETLRRALAEAGYAPR